jgi:imidazolonepropionase-like amidohydrolase
MIVASGCAARHAPQSIELRNGRWLDAKGFTARTVYIVDGRLTSAEPLKSTDSIIDLAGGFVIPPFGEAHNHNLVYSTPAGTDSLIAGYLRAGVFYVKNPGNLPRDRDSLQGRINIPTGVDVVFSNGLLTATGGHPSGLWKRNVERGGMTLEDGDGGFMWLLNTPADLAHKWPRILAQKPDFIKTVLVHSEEYALRRQDTAYYNWRGLDPALIPEIVQRAHAAGLRVTAHVETAADFHNAVRGGVDEVNHTPGFRGDERAQLPDPGMFEVSVEDAREAARRAVVVLTTVGGISSVDPAGPDSLRRRAFDRLSSRNLRILRDAGVHLGIGSDGYRDNSTREVQYLEGLGVFGNLELLRLWSEATPRAIFPERKVGCLADGCEASFLVLSGNPESDFSHVRNIRLRVKDGRVLP